MKQTDRASRLRQEIARLGAQWRGVQEKMLRPRRMLGASLIERHLGTRDQKRASSAFYLSWSEGGRTVLRYVPREQVASRRAQVEAWREYRRLRRRCRQVAERLLELLERLGEAQSPRPDVTGQAERSGKGQR
jgi:hypothetical protein